MSGLIFGEKDGGGIAPVRVDEEGRLVTAAETTGPGGEELATEETAEREADATEALAEALAPGGTPTPGQTAIAVVNVDPAPTFAAAPAEGTDLTAIYLAGTAPFLPDRDDVLRAAFVEVNSGDIATGVGTISGQLPEELAASGGLKTEIVAPLPSGTNPLGTVEVTSSALPSGASTSALQGAGLPAAFTSGGGVKVGLVDALPAGANALGSVAVSSSALPSGASTEVTLATRASEATAQSIKDAVDGLEAGQATGNATQSALLAAFLDTMGPYSRTTFGQLRVAMRETQFDNVQEYGLDARAWGTQTANGGTVAFNTTTGMTDLTVTSASGSTAKLRTNTHFIYQPGAVTRIILTVVHGSAGVANQRRRWGFFNDSDGIFFELNGTSLSLVRRTSTGGSPVDAPIPQASWTAPGNAPTLTNGNRFEIELQWLSFGTVRVWANGLPLHTFEFANSIVLPYTRTAQLPISLEIENTGASTAATLSYVCSTVYLDGGTPLKFVPKERALAAPKTGIGTTYAPLIGLRMASTVAGRTNRKIVIPTTQRVANASGRATVAVILNPASTTGGTWTAADAASGVEYNEGIVSYTGGTELTRIFLPNTADSRELDGESSFALNGLHLRRDAFNTTGDLVLFVGKADVGTSDIDIVARWKELG